MSQIQVSYFDSRKTAIGEFSFVLPANIWDAARILGIDGDRLHDECSKVCASLRVKLSGWKRNGEFLKVSNDTQTCLIPVFIR